MSSNVRRLIILISSFSLLAVLILNFFFFQKSDEESFITVLEEEIQQIDREFDEDFVQILMVIRPDEEITFDRISSSANNHPFFILNPEKQLLFWSDFTFTLNFDQVDENKEYQLLEDPYGKFLLKNRKRCDD